MGRTEFASDLLSNGTVERDDLNIATAGKAVVRKILAGTAISISNTGVDPGTGDVTVNVNITGAASTIVSNNLSTGKILVSDSNGKVSASAQAFGLTDVVLVDDGGGKQYNFYFENGILMSVEQL